MLTFDERLALCYKTNYKKYVNRLKRPFNNNLADAEDVIQNSVERALRYREAYDPEKGSFDNWFSKIVYHTMCEHLNKHAARKEDDIEKYQQLADINYVVIIENKETVKKIIRLHPKPLPRKFLTLYFIKGYPLSDIRAKLQIKEDLARQILFRFRKFLKDKYQIGV